VKLNDTVWGGLLLALSFAILWNVRTFPHIPGQSIGPAAFPAMLAIALAGCAIALIVRGLRAGHARLVFGDWIRSPHHVGNFMLTVAVLLFYIFAADTLGFLITAALILMAMFLKLGVRVKVALPVAIGTVFFIHIVFYKLLRVTLPWGVLPVLY
jgi:putative tricarboxylic transport membrane protein